MLEIVDPEVLATSGERFHPVGIHTGDPSDSLPKARLDEYKDLARKASKVWLEQGALSYVEATGDDVPYGELTSFPRAMQAKDDEIVILAWITYKSRAERDHMIFGGFEAFVEA